MLQVLYHHHLEFKDFLWIELIIQIQDKLLMISKSTFQEKDISKHKRQLRFWVVQFYQNIHSMIKLNQQHQMNSKLILIEFGKHNYLL